MSRANAVDGLKRCSYCGTEQPLSNFHRNRKQSHGCAAYCKPCAKSYKASYKLANPNKFKVTARKYYLAHKEECDHRNRAWVAANIHTVRSYRKRYHAVRKAKELPKKFGITVEHYAELLAKQGGVCAICHKSCRRALAVDHDHLTGQVRGLLCSRCNLVLGVVHDDVVVLCGAAAYLEQIPALKNEVA